MPVEVGTAYLPIVPDLSNLQREIERNLRGVNTQSAGNQMGTSLGTSMGDGLQSGVGGAVKKVAGIAAAGFAAVGVKDFIASTVEQASDLGETATKLQAVFGDGTAAVEEYATKGAKALGQSNLAVKDAASTFGVFGKAAGLAGDANAKFSTDLVGLSTDLASFYNEDPAAVVEALGAGLRGEAEPLRRFGILMDDATLRQKALSMGLISTTKDALQPQQKVLAAQALIMEQTAVAQGDFAKTSGGLANQQRILAAQWTDAKGKLGQVFLPAVTATVTALNEKLFPALDWAGDKVGGFFKLLKGDEVAVADAGPVGKAIAGWGQQLRDGQQSIKDGVDYYWRLFSGDEATVEAEINTGGPVGQHIALWGRQLRAGQEMVGEQLGRIWKLFSGDEATVEDEINNGGPVGQTIALWGRQLRNAQAELGPIASQLFGVLVGRGLSDEGPLTADSPIVEFLTSVRDIAGDVLPVLKQMFSDVWAVIEPLFSSLVTTLGPAVVDVFNTLWDAVKPLLPMLGELVPLLNPLHLLFEALAPLVPQIASAVADLARTLANVVGRALQALMPLFQKLVDVIGRLMPVVQSLIAKLLPPLVNLFDKIAPLLDAVLDALIPVVDALMDALIPAIDALMPVVELVFGFIAETVENVMTILGGLIDFVTGVFKGDWDQVWSGLSQVWDGLVAQFHNVFDTLMSFLKEWFTNLVPTTWGILSGFAGKLVEWGGQFLGWLWDGIKLAGEGLGQWFSALPGLIWEKLSAFGSQLVEWGGQLLSWMWDGIKANGLMVLEWYASLPGWIWEKLSAFASQLVEWGAQFLSWVWDGIKSTGAAVLDWFFNLPTWIRDKLFGFAVDLAIWGAQFLQWAFDGIASTGEKVLQWFKDLPGVLWGGLLTFGGSAALWLAARGTEFVNWLKNGITGAGEGIITWFKELPGKAVDAIMALAGKLLELGGNLVKWIADGIANAAHFIIDALKDIFSSDLINEGESPTGVNGEGPNTGRYSRTTAPGAGGGIAQGRLAMAAGGGMYSAGYDGAVLPGFAPGLDYMHALLSPGEAVMVPEWVQMVGPANVYAMNRAARGGRFVPPGKFLGGSDLYAAGGGVLQVAAKDAGGRFSEQIGKGIRSGKDKDAAVDTLLFGNGTSLFDGLISLGRNVAIQLATPTAAGFNASQDPSSFGWKRASGIVPFSWNGKPVLGGVAGGTEPLWNALLSALVPQIPGGLTEPMYGYENRDNVNSPGTPSFHSYGLAVDINASANPNGVSAASVQGRPGAIPIGLARSLAAKLGMVWGGDFRGTPDPMHFEVHVPPSGINANSAGGAAIGALGQQLASLVAGKFGFGAGANPAAVTGGAFIPNVERWRPMATQALAAFGYGSEWVDAMLWQMTTESSGDPNAINLTDSNARKGTPSKGLLQTIDSTFRGNLQGTPYANLISRGPYDPWANMLAAVSYVQRRYGGPGVWNKAIGGNPNPYDTGGWLMPGGSGVNLLNQPEAVLQPHESKAFVQMAKVAAAGGDGASLPQLVINLDSSDPLQVAVAQMIGGGMQELARELATAGARG